MGSRGCVVVVLLTLVVIGGMAGEIDSPPAFAVGWL